MNDANNYYITPKQAQKLLGCSYSTLRRMVHDKRIHSTVTPSGRTLFRFPYPQPQSEILQNSKICYCRVSTKKQAPDLNNQVEFCRRQFPDHQIITDFGSALNFNRKGLKTILDRVYQGTVSEIVVTHRDRLCRFGFELFEYIFDKHRVKLVVLDKEVPNELNEFSNDIISIIRVFSARYYGKRKYLKSKPRIIKQPRIIKPTNTGNTINEKPKGKIVLNLIPKKNLQSVARN